MHLAAHRHHPQRSENTGVFGLGSARKMTEWLSEVMGRFEAFISDECPYYDHTVTDRFMVIINWLPILVFFLFLVLPFIIPQTLFYLLMSAGQIATYLLSLLAALALPKPDADWLLCMNRASGRIADESSQSAFLLVYFVLRELHIHCDKHNIRSIAYCLVLCAYTALVNVSNTYLRLFTPYECMIASAVGAVGGVASYTVLDRIITPNIHSHWLGMVRWFLPESEMPSERSAGRGWRDYELSQA